MDSYDILYPEEKKYLISLGYLFDKDIFYRDICKKESNYYSYAIAVLAQRLGYRDHWDKNFQHARQVFRKLYTVGSIA